MTPLINTKILIIRAFSTTVQKTLSQNIFEHIQNAEIAHVFKNIINTPTKNRITISLFYLGSWGATNHLSVYARLWFMQTPICKSSFYGADHYNLDMFLFRVMIKQMINVLLHNSSLWPECNRCHKHILLDRRNWKSLIRKEVLKKLLKQHIFEKLLYKTQFVKLPNLLGEDAPSSKISVNHSNF